MNQLLRNWDKNNGWVGEYSAGLWLSPFHPSPWHLRRKLNYCVFKIMNDVHECYILNCIFLSFLFSSPLSHSKLLPVMNSLNWMNGMYSHSPLSERNQVRGMFHAGLIVSLYKTQNKRDARKHWVTSIYIYLTLPRILHNSYYYYYYYYYYYVQVSQ